MDSKELLRDLRDAINGVVDKQQSTIQADALQRYLDNWEKSADNKEKESEAVHARKLEEWKAQLSVSSAASIEMFKAVIEAGLTALKSSIVINGGSAATLLALLAEGLKANGAGGWGAMLSPLGWAWLCFMLGLGFAGTATGARYFSQATYAEAQRRGEGPEKIGGYFKVGNWFRNFAASLGVGSYLLFFIGAGIIFKVIIAGHS